MANANALPAYGSTAVPMCYYQAWDILSRALASIQAGVTQMQGLIAAGPVAAQNIVNMSNGFVQQNATLTQIAALGTPLAAWAATQGVYLSTLGSANIITGFQAIQAAVVAITNWVGANAPGNSLAPNSSGQWVSAIIPQAELAPLTALLTALSVTIT